MIKHTKQHNLFDGHIFLLCSNYPFYIISEISFKFSLLLRCILPVFSLFFTISCKYVLTSFWIIYSVDIPTLKLTYPNNLRTCSLKCYENMKKKSVLKVSHVYTTYACVEVVRSGERKNELTWNGSENLPTADEGHENAEAPGEDHLCVPAGEDLGKAEIVFFWKSFQARKMSHTRACFKLN